MDEDELDLYAGSDKTEDNLPEGLDFGDSPEVDNDADLDAPAGQPAGDAADDAGDADRAAGDRVDEAGDGDDGAEPEKAEPDEADAEPEKAPEKDEPVKPEKEPRIPKSRLDQALRKQRLAEQRAQEAEQALAELRSAQAEAQRPKPLSAEEIQARMAEANEALIAGDPTKAAEIQAQILAAMTAATAPAKGEPAAERDVVAEVEARIEFKQVLNDTYARFPELDENSESFNEELAQEAVVLQRGYLDNGYSLSEATQRAATAVAKLHDLRDRKAVVEKPATPPAKRVLDAKTQQKVAKATTAPPPLAGKPNGEGDERLDINSMTEDELMALPASALDKLLGNVF